MAGQGGSDGAQYYTAATMGYPQMPASWVVRDGQGGVHPAAIDPRMMAYSGVQMPYYGQQFYPFSGGTVQQMQV